MIRFADFSVSLAFALNLMLSNFFATIKTDTALADLLAAVTVNFSGSDGTLNLYAWGHNGTDPTLAASTSTLTVEWMAFGT